MSEGRTQGSTQSIKNVTYENSLLKYVDIGIKMFIF